MAIELATAYVSLSTSAKGMRKEIDRELGAVGDDAGRRAGGRFTGALTKVGKAGAVAAGGAIAAGFGAALVKGFGRLTAIEAAEAKLSGLGHSAAEVEQIMANAGAAVKGTAFGLGDAASAAASAVAAGVKPGKDLERTLKLVGDAAAIAGADYSEMASIFNKVSAGGVIQGEELAQLGDRGIPILQLLGEELGVSAAQVRKLASEGKIDFETFQNAMEAGMGGAALESGKTFQGAMDNVGAALGRLGASLLSGVFPKIAPMLQGVIGWLDTMAPAAATAGAALGSALEWASGVIGTLVEQFRNSEGPTGRFRDVLTAVGDAAKSVFGWLRDEGLPALQALGDFVMNRLWPDLNAAFLDYIIPAMREVGRVIKNFWEGDAQPALRGMWEFIKNILAPFLVDFYENGIKPTFRLIGDAIAGAWNNVIKPTFSALKDGGTAVKDRFVAVKDGIKTAWDRVASIVSGGWDKIKGVLDKFKAGLSSLRDRVTSVKDGIARTWSAVGAAFAKPINKVIDTVNGFLEGLRKGINKIPGVNLEGNWGVIPQVPVPAAAAGGGGGVGPRGPIALAHGGMVPGRSPHKRADNIPAWLTAGEYVLPVDAVRSLVKKFGPGVLDRLRRGEGEGTGFAGGGGGWLSKMGDWAGAIFDGGKRVVTELFNELISRAGFDDSFVGQAAKGAILNTADAFLRWAKESIFGGPGSVGAPVNGRISYGYGPRHLFAKPDFHTGIDYAVPTGTAVRAAGPGSAYVGYDRLGGNYVGIAHPGSLHTGYLHLSQALVKAGQAVTKGQIIARSGNTGTMTTGPHLHFQVGKGGSFWNHINPYAFLGSGSPIGGGGGGAVKPLLFDQGGYLPTGLSVVRNNTGRPEPLRRVDQEGPQQIVGKLELVNGEAHIRGIILDSPQQVARSNARGVNELGGRLAGA